MQVLLRSAKVSQQLVWLKLIALLLPGLRLGPVQGRMLQVMVASSSNNSSSSSVVMPAQARRWSCMVVQQTHLRLLLHLCRSTWHPSAPQQTPTCWLGVRAGAAASALLAAKWAQLCRTEQQSMLPHPQLLRLLDCRSSSQQQLQVSRHRVQTQQQLLQWQQRRWAVQQRPRRHCQPRRFRLCRALRVVVEHLLGWLHCLGQSTVAAAAAVGQQQQR
jgi:hypothetical protein